MGEVTSSVTRACRRLMRSECSLPPRNKANDSGGEPIQPGAEPEAGLVQAVSTPIAQVLLALALAALFWFALDPAILAGFSAGSLVAFIAAATQLGKPIRTLTNVRALFRGLAAAEDLFAQIDAERSPITAADLERARGDLLDQVSFTYPGADSRCSRTSAYRFLQAKWWRLSGAREPARAASCICCVVFMRRALAPSRWMISRSQILSSMIIGDSLAWYPSASCCSATRCGLMLPLGNWILSPTPH